MTNKSYSSDFERFFGLKADVVNNTLAELLDGQSGIEQPLRDALGYTLNAPGKRVRGALVLCCCELAAGEVRDSAKIAAAAIEMVHTYSLVHDDLPAMDDDDLRRGQPSCHKAFDEATAILAGDALLTMAFEVLADNVENANLAVELIKTLAVAAGPAGMIAGQMADLQSENLAATIEGLQGIHTNKTAKMFAAAAKMGAACGGGTAEQTEQLYSYGLTIGLGFQVADDILDVSATSKHLGKTAGKDAMQGKATYPAIIGMENSMATANSLADKAIAALEEFGTEANMLRELVMKLLERTR